MPKLQASPHIKNCAPFVARVSEALNVAPATPVADALVVTCVGGQGMGEKSKSQNMKQLDVAGAI